MKNKDFFKNFPAFIFVAMFITIFFAGAIVDRASGGMVIYPAKEQTPEQQKQDEYECHQWAVEQTGFDPTKTQQVTQQESSPKGGAIKGAAGGALVGAGIGAIAGDARKGAAIGAGAGAVGGGAKQRQQRQQQEAAAQQAQANQQAQINNYNKAKSACLEGRGYTVK
jgi:hypothetical protein